MFEMVILFYFTHLAICLYRNLTETLESSTQSLKTEKVLNTQPCSQDLSSYRPPGGGKMRDPGNEVVQFQRVAQGVM